MKKISLCTVLVLISCLILAQPLEAQVDKRGPGGIIDWIHRLSGPMMLSAGASYSWQFQENGIRIRIGAALGLPVASDDKIGDDQKLNLFSFLPSLEIPVPRVYETVPLEFKTGINVHRFGGKGHAPVWNLSFPIFAQFHFDLTGDDNLFLRIAGGPLYFPAFSNDAFDQEIDVNRTSGEWTTALRVGIDFIR